MDSVGCVVIGAGVVGLAVARALALQGEEVFILEETEGIGNHASSRNSEVVHAGLYYESGSLKSKLCTRGRILLYSYFEKAGIRYDRIGKIVVATERNEAVKLNQIANQARLNGVDDIVVLGRQEIASLEPNLKAELAIFSPSTCIFDSHQFMTSLLKDAEKQGAMIVFSSPVVGGHVQSDGIVLDVGGMEPTQVLCRKVIICAGINSSEVASSLKGFPPSKIPKTYLCKGSYFTYGGKVPFKHLIYPLPEEAGFGIHLTLDLSGKPRFGPDAEWVNEVDYTVDESRSELFYRSVKRFWPEIERESLQPGYSGIRAKVSGPGEEAADFIIQGPSAHGIRGLVALYGIESPGLTACLAIAEEVEKGVREEP